MKNLKTCELNLQFVLALGPREWLTLNKIGYDLQ